MFLFTHILVPNTRGRLKPTHVLNPEGQKEKKNKNKK
jgi:hypothetical protein